MSNTKKQIRQSILFVSAVCVILVIVCICGFLRISNDQRKQLEEHLEDTSELYSNTIQRQVVGDMEILQGMAALLGEQANIDKSILLDILEQENNQNRFMRMGFIDMLGNAFLVDINGERYENINISHEYHVQEVLKGNAVLSDSLQDRYTDKTIVVYAVPIFSDGKQIGALCAVNSTDVFSSIIEQPAMQESYANIIKQNGDIVIHTTKINNSSLTSVYDISFDREDDKDLLKTNLAENKAGSFHFTNVEGAPCLAHYTSLDINDWVIVSIIPESILDSTLTPFRKIAFFFMASIVIIMLLLIVFVTHIIMRSHEALEHLVYFDSLTGIYTKTKFSIMANRLLNHDQGYALIKLDIADFKVINQLFGFPSGDALLVYIAAVLKEHIHEHELYYRSDGDCFGALLHESDPEALKERIQHIMDHIATYELHPQQHYHIISNCGVRFIEEEKNLDTIMDHAAIALKEAKEKAETHIVFYGNELSERLQQIKQIENRMYSAIEEKEFEVYLQPKYSFSTGTIIGAEALVRWNIDGHIIPPDIFIPIFEKNGFITRLDMYVFDAVCGFLHKWDALGYPKISVNVNQTRLLFYRDNYIHNLKSILAKHQISAKRFILEITESIVVENLEVIAEMTKQLHDLGFRISMDDFGSGYSSLNILQSLDFDELKMDRVFLSDRGSNVQKQKEIIKTVVKLAKALSITTVAEGVETKEQVNFLTSIGCDIAQGYYYAKPMQEPEFEKLLEKTK